MSASMKGHHLGQMICTLEGCCRGFGRNGGRPTRDGIILFCFVFVLVSLHHGD